MTYAIHAVTSAFLSLADYLATVWLSEETLQTVRREFADYAGKRPPVPAVVFEEGDDDHTFTIGGGGDENS